MLHPAMCRPGFEPRPEDPIREHAVEGEKAQQRERIKEAKVVAGIERPQLVKYRRKRARALLVQSLVRTRALSFSASAS